MIGLELHIRAEIVEITTDPLIARYGELLAL